MDIVRIIKAAVLAYENPSPLTFAQLFGAVVEVALPFIPHEQLASALDDAARKRVDAIADAAEDLKFGPKA